MVPSRAFRPVAGLRWGIPLCLALVLGASAAGAAEPDSSWAVVVEKPSPSGPSLIPIPILFYTPETKVGFGASVLYLFGEGEGALKGRPSSLSTVGIYTQKKQVIAGVAGDLYLGHRADQLSGSVFYQDFPTEFYGVGNGTEASAQEDYTPRKIEIMLRGTRRVRGPLQLGITGLAQHLELRDIEEEGLLARDLVRGADGGWTVGLGALVGVDTRDAVFSARRGAFAEIGVDLHEAFLGSDYSFTRWRVDLRGYQALFSTHVLAVRALGVATLGDPPFYHLPQLGGANLLRGYYEGRFRDHDLVAFQTEYRVPLFWRVTGAVFGGLGQVAHDASKLRADAFHWAAGFGGRFLLNEESRLTIRVDQGFGEEGNGFYFSFGEAF